MPHPSVRIIAVCPRMVRDADGCLCHEESRPGNRGRMAAQEAIEHFGEGEIGAAVAWLLPG
jgi:hypothetical protein